LISKTTKLPIKTQRTKSKKILILT